MDRLIVIYILAISFLPTLIIGLVWIGNVAKNGTVISANCQVMGYSIQPTSNSLNAYLDLCLEDVCQEAILIYDWDYNSFSLQCYLESTYPVNSTISCYEYSKTKELFLGSRPDSLLTIFMSVFGSIMVIVWFATFTILLRIYMEERQTLSPSVLS